ncbi:MAG TPA: hypothetical protein VK195_17650 [Burkholderiaceae bacterium]|nr:hypothetical protein [Burkholderiaceae bacterium]
MVQIDAQNECAYVCAFVIPNEIDSMSQNAALQYQKTLGIGAAALVGRMA